MILNILAERANVRETNHSDYEYHCSCHLPRVHFADSAILQHRGGGLQRGETTCARTWRSQAYCQKNMIL